MNKEKLNAPMPEWAVKDHPAKKGMTVIDPMSVIDRLNEVFGVGEWQIQTEHIHHEQQIQKTRNGERNIWVGASKVTLTLPNNKVIEQFGGSTNDDLGDALKGSATDALTKCASYLGIGASIYKGQGNKENETVVKDLEYYADLITDCEDLNCLKTTWVEIPSKFQVNLKTIKEELKIKLS